MGRTCIHSIFLNIQRRWFLCPFACLPQHLVILYLMAVSTADLSFQNILKESPVDVDQQSGGTGVDSTARDHIVHVLGHMDPKPKDHTHQQTLRLNGRENNRVGHLSCIFFINPLTSAMHGYRDISME